MSGWTSFLNFGLNTREPLHQAPGGEDQILGLEAFVCAMATALDLLAKLGSLKIVPETVEVPIIGLQISHRLEQLAERDVAVGVDDAAYVARIARDVLRVALAFPACNSGST